MSGSYIMFIDLLKLKISNFEFGIWKSEIRKCGMANYSTYKYIEFYYIPDRTAVCPLEDHLVEIYASMTSSPACKS